MTDCVIVNKYGFKITHLNGDIKTTHIAQLPGYCVCANVEIRFFNPVQVTARYFKHTLVNFFGVKKRLINFL